MARTFAARLLAWFDQCQRDLPWRRSRDPWAIWVSEIMLQQTRVEAVRDAYERFMAAYPDPAAFAAVTDDELMRAWRGLGYYRRARLLRDGAHAVVRDHDGRVPNDPDALGQLPGIGTYTRGAIASIAFDVPEPAVDGNVERVFARHRGITTDIKAGPAQRAVREHAAAELDPRRPGDFNQALMELGATVCTPRSPRCADCPVAADCTALAEGTAAELPARKPRPEPIDVTSRAVLVLKNGQAPSSQALGARVPDDEPNAGQIELPGAGVLVTADAATLGGVLQQRYAANVTVGSELARVRHAITRHRITYCVHGGEAEARGRLRWHPIDEETPWTTVSRKAFRQADRARAEPE